MKYNVGQLPLKGSAVKCIVSTTSVEWQSDVEHRRDSRCDDLR